MATMGERIATQRARRGLTPSELAKRAKIPLSTLSVVERGIRKGEGLSVATAKRLAEALGVSLDYLAGMYEDQDGERPPVNAAVASRPPVTPRAVSPPKRPTPRPRMRKTAPATTGHK